MQRKRINIPFLYVFGLGLLISHLACKNSKPVPTINSQGFQSQQELEELRSERNELIDELTELKLSKTEEVNDLSLERQRLTTEKKQVEDQIELLREEIAATEISNQEERTRLMAELEEAQTSQKTLEDMLKENEDKLEAAQKEIEELDAEVKRLNAKIDEMQARIDTLEAELAAEKAKNAAKQDDTVKTDDTQDETKDGDEAATSVGEDTTNYIFRYAQGNDCLEVANSSVANNVQIMALPCNTAARNQHFAAPTAKTEVFFILKARHSAKCVAIDANAKNMENAPVKQQSCDLSADEHYWEFYVRGDKDFRLRNKASGKCLKIASDGKVVQGDCDTNYTFFNWLSVE